MILYNQAQLQHYLQRDSIFQLLAQYPDDAAYTSHRWLLDSPPKRMIAQHLYGDLLAPGNSPSVLDVGGGYSGLTRLYLQHSQYEVLDIMAHDDHDQLRTLEADLGSPFWICSDWHSFDIADRWDLVIANDLFPNVDQRLALFLDKFLPHASEIRVSLTFYDVPRSYQVKRVDADEILWLLAWNSTQLASVLAPYAEQIVDFAPACLQSTGDSLFANGRQVCQVVLRGAG